MNPLTIIQDSLYFFRRNFASILTLCLPLVVLEALTKQLLASASGPDSSASWQLLIGLLFYPLYTGALILFLSAKTRSETPAKRDLLAATLRMWPTFAVLTALSTLLIMAGLSLFIAPGVWVMIKLVFSEYLLVLRGLGPLEAMRESFRMTRGHMVRILTCVLFVYIPLSVLEALSYYVLPDQQSPLLSLAVDSISSFLQLFISVAMFRLFMLIDEPARPA
ncbi:MULTISPECIES: YciC family protein [unclassified Pseudomonas]|uniref:YciC family protein n=1 Tax=unclassified Pseudomonas TaxID=196821 RepID=UPI0025CBBFC6|nr:MULTISPECIES: YciC family protein [unclassified Pseudomonas]